MRRSSVAKGCCHDAPKHCEYLGGNHKAQTCVGSVGGNEQFATSSYISPISDQAGLCRHCLVLYCNIHGCIYSVEPTHTGLSIFPGPSGFIIARVAEGNLVRNSMGIRGNSMVVSGNSMDLVSAWSYKY